ncbi:MAG: InlB B-repeat-containing protein [Bacteroidales bacterium]|nr:InlB B-repeat-containing protein [Bacteroidales bacterium]
MKKHTKALTAIMLMIAMVCAVGCEPDEQDNNGNNNGGGEEPTYYSINIAANPTNGGTVSGDGKYEKGHPCTIIATPATGYTFTNWTENGSQVSTDASYTFTVTCDRNLTANFTSTGGGEQPKYYAVSITMSPVEGGWTEGSGRYKEGEPCTVTASPDFLYTFTNWTENDLIVSESASFTFIVTRNISLVANFTIMSAGSYVDLGLPSGNLWAACNIGANTPEEYGDYFAWGETTPKSRYNCDNYQHCHGCVYEDVHLVSMTKYCTNSSFGFNGFTDDLTVLLPEDDAAKANWGEGWRMPYLKDWEELLNNTTGQFISLDNADGILLTAANGAALFFPAAGFRSENTTWYAGSNGNYWASSLDQYEPDCALSFSFNSGCGSIASGFRFCGRSVRAVRSQH